MLIAEDLVKNGMTSGDKFNRRLTTFVKDMGFKKIIETGTYHGTGTTKAILNGLSGKYEFYSIEVNPEHYKIAQENLQSFIRGGLRLLHGLSVGRPDLPVSITADLPDFVVIDHQPKNRMQKYLKEVSYACQDHMLDYALDKFDYKPDFVLLDSAGHMGYIEFLYLMRRVRGSFYLALDDTRHHKHFESMQYIRQHKEFEIIWEDQDKFGSAIMKYNHAV